MTKKRSGRKGQQRKPQASPANKKKSTKPGVTNGVFANLPFELVQDILELAYAEPASAGDLWKAQHVNQLFRKAIRKSGDLRHQLIKALQVDVTFSFDDVKFDSRLVKPVLPREKPMSRGTKRTGRARPLYIKKAAMEDVKTRNSSETTLPPLPKDVFEIRLRSRSDPTRGLLADLRERKEGRNIQYVKAVWYEDEFEEDGPLRIRAKFIAEAEVKKNLNLMDLHDVIVHLIRAHPGNHLEFPEGLDLAQDELFESQWEWKGYSYMPGAAVDTSEAKQYIVGEPTYKHSFKTFQDFRLPTHFTCGIVDIGL